MTCAKVVRCRWELDISWLQRAKRGSAADCTWLLAGIIAPFAAHCCWQCNLALSRIVIYFPGCCQAFAAPVFGGSFCHSTSAATACTQTQTRTSRCAHARRCCYSYYQNVLINPFTLPLILPLPMLLQSLVARSLRLAMARRIRQEFALQLDAVQSARCKYHHGARLVLCVRYFKLINLC